MSKYPDFMSEQIASLLTCRTSIVVSILASPASTPPVIHLILTICDFTFLLFIVYIYHSNYTSNPFAVTPGSQFCGAGTEQKLRSLSPLLSVHHHFIFSFRCHTRLEPSLWTWLHHSSLPTTTTPSETEV